MSRLLSKWILLGTLLLPLTLQGQLSPYETYQELYDQALELFEKKHYGAAQKKVDEFLGEEKNLRGPLNNDLHTNARFMQAVGAYHLQRNDTEALLNDFLQDYSTNTKATQIEFYLGKLYFDKQNFRGAIRPFLAAYQSGNLPASMMDELIFRLAYSYFMDGQNELATRYFTTVAGRKNDYQEDARYYQSVILYQEEDYEGAYIAFKELERSPKYGKEIRVYLANTLLKLKRYDELYVLAEELISGPKLSGKERQVYYVVANASFERQDFPRTSEYFTQYTKARGKMSKTDQFRYGYAYYKQQKYADAIPIFQRALGGADSLEQVASYYLGFCYLEEKDEQNARFAFKKASEQQDNPQIAEDALYQYARLSFATENYSDAITSMRQLTKNYPDAPYIEEIQAMIGEAFLYTRNYPESIKYFESIPRRSNRVRQAYQQVCYYFGLEAFERAAFNIAETNFRKAIDNSYDDDMALSARFWLGESKFRDGKFDEAIKQYDTFLADRGASKNEFYARSFYGLGWSNFKLKNYAEALKGFEDFIAKGGRNNDKNLVVDAYLRAGDSEFLRRRYDAANRYYQRVIDFRYTFRDYALYQIGESNYRQAKYTASTQSFAKLIENFKRSELRDNALDRISEIYLTWLNNEAQASKYAKILVQDYPRSPLAAGAYNRLAIAAFNAGDANGAIGYFKKVLQDYSSDKTNAQVALENLSALLDPADFDKVFRDYRNANPDLDNNVASIAFNTGKDRFFSGNYPSAIEQFSTYIKDFKGGQDYLESLLFRARSYRELGQYSNALKDFQSIYSTPATNAFTSQALLEAGDIRYEQREFLSSLKLFEQLYDVSGKTQNRVQALFGQAKNRKAMEDYQEAINDLNKIVSNNEVAVYSRTQARVEIGNCQYLAGALDQAMATFGEIEKDFKNEFGAESQYMIVRIFYDKGINLKVAGDDVSAKAQFEQSKSAGLYQRNTYPTFNLWNARTFLYVAEANYELGESFQAIGVLESLINEAPFDDIKQQAQKRLDEIRAEEAANDPSNGGE